MVDLAQKTRHAVEMACAARSLARAAPSDHLKRVLARYVFVYLHDVTKFSAAWRNQLLGVERTRLTAVAAVPALKRLRTDWETYKDIRHYLGAKRQLRDPADAASDQLATFELWSEIGQLSVETLVDDAVELYVQLAALEQLGTIDAEPVVSDTSIAALASIEPVGDEAFLEVNASSFGSAKPNTVVLRMGGDIGRLVPLINDVAESALVLARLSAVEDLDDPIRRLVACALPSEISELLRLSIGPPLSVQRHTLDTSSLLAYFRKPKRSPDARVVLEHLDNSISQQTQEELLDWRDRLGAHTDENTAWGDLRAGIDSMDLGEMVELLDWIELNLVHAACTQGGPVLLMLGTRRLKTLLPTLGYEGGLPYEDADSNAKPGDLRSALPPTYADSEYAIWINGPQGSILSGAIAGMVAGRSKQVTERLEQIREKHRGP